MNRAKYLIFKISLFVPILFGCGPKKVKEPAESGNVAIEHSSVADSFNLSLYNPEFAAYWEKFGVALESSNIKELTRNSLIQLDCNGNVKSSEEFFVNDYKNIFSRNVLACIKNRKGVYFDETLVDNGYFPEIVEDELKGPPFKMVRISLTDHIDNRPFAMQLFFLKTKSGYKFYGYTKVGID